MARIAEVRNHSGDAPGRRAAQRVGDDKQLHQVVVRRVRGRLDDEHILAADVLEDFDEDLSVVEALYTGIDKIDGLPAMHGRPLGDSFGKGPVRVTGNEFRFGDRGHWFFFPLAARRMTDS